jgi:CrcB protein
VLSRQARVIVLGGMIGTSLRMVITGLFPTRFPWAGLAVNLVGAAMLGFLLPRLLMADRRLTLVVPFVAVGIIGSFTTFSGLLVELVELLLAGDYLLSIGYAIASLAGGLLLAFLSMRLASRRIR